MIRRIIIGISFILSLAVIAFLVAVAMKSNSYSVERSTTIKAAPDVIFPLVNDFQEWDEWSPFKDLDPKAKVTISKPSAGKGAKMEWDGNDQVGAGTMLILKSEPHERVLMEQSFTRPKQGACDVVFTFAPAGNETKVTWQFNGNYGGFAEKAICLVMNLDAMLGPKMEEGLASLKNVAEEPKKAVPEKKKDVEKEPVAAAKE